MALNLTKVSKGESSNLDWLKKGAGKKLAFVGLGWDSEADLDASLLMLGANGMPRSQDDLFFYHHLHEGSVREHSPIIHTGDARESEDDDNGDEEVILINFDKIPSDVSKLAVVVSIYGAGVVFGQVRNAYVRVCSCTDEALWLKGEGGKEELRYDLEEEASTSNALLFCEIVRSGGDWQFKAIGEAIGDGTGDNGLVPIVQKYGLG